MAANDRRRYEGTRMRNRERNYLFADFDLADSLQAKQTAIQEQVDRITKDQFLTAHTMT